VPGALQAQLQPVGDRIPAAPRCAWCGWCARSARSVRSVCGGEGEGDEAPTQLGEHLLDQALIAGEADLEGVFQHQRQQLSRSGAAEDGAAVAGGEQIGQPPDVVDVHMRNDQGLDGGDREADLQVLGSGAVGAGLGAPKTVFSQRPQSISSERPSARTSAWQEPVTPSMAPWWSICIRKTLVIVRTPPSTPATDQRSA